MAYLGFGLGGRGGRYGGSAGSFLPSNLAYIHNCEDLLLMTLSSESSECWPDIADISITSRYDYISVVWIWFKGEVRSWSNLISEEKSKIFWTKQWKPDKNRLTNKEVMTLSSFANFSGNISWPVRMNIQMSELMSSTHYLPYILYIKFWKF